MLLMGIGMMGYKLAVTQFAKSMKRCYHLMLREKIMHTHTFFTYFLGTKSSVGCQSCLLLCIGGSVGSVH